MFPLLSRPSPQQHAPQGPGQAPAARSGHRAAGAAHLRRPAAAAPRPAHPAGQGPAGAPQTQSPCLKPATGTHTRYPNGYQLQRISGEPGTGNISWKIYPKKGNTIVNPTPISSMYHNRKIQLQAWKWWSSRYFSNFESQRCYVSNYVSFHAAWSGDGNFLDPDWTPEKSKISLIFSKKAPQIRSCWRFPPTNPKRRTRPLFYHVYYLQYVHHYAPCFSLRILNKFRAEKCHQHLQKIMQYLSDHFKTFPDIFCHVDLIFRWWGCGKPIQVFFKRKNYGEYWAFHRYFYPHNFFL